jgi:hypothetical protein
MYNPQWPLLICPAQPSYHRPYPTTPGFLSGPPLVHHLEDGLSLLFGMLLAMLALLWPAEKAGISGYP